MIADGAHFTYIAWAYAGVFIGVAGLVAYVMWDSFRARKRLEDLEKAGLRRRSAGTAN